MDQLLQLTCEDYTVGWLSALPQSELVAAMEMLDNEHEASPHRNQYDQNMYSFGSINRHNVVIACLPPGVPGKVSAQQLVEPLRQTFPNMRLHLFVSIAGGVPRDPPPKIPSKDIHLGDVVVAWAEGTGVPSIIPYDYIRYLGPPEHEQLGSFDKPNRQLLNALGAMLTDRIRKKSNFYKHLQRSDKVDGFSHSGLDKDILFEADYECLSRASSGCENCDPLRKANRNPRDSTDPVFHQGTILTGDSVMQNAKRRDKLSKRYYNAMAFEMEAGGVVDSTHCLIIRGISDYSDSHKILIWQN